MSRALLLVAHGSRREASNDEVRELTRQLALRITGYSTVDYAFLELAQPDIVSSGNRLIEEGATSLTIIPYFLVAGKHVQTDVPEMVAEIAARWPDVAIHITPYLGAANGVLDLVLGLLPDTE